MQIISHRGYWIDKTEKNRKIAFERSFTMGFGTETDIRDFNGNLVISHDVPDKKCLLVEEFLALFTKINPKLPLALNIKSDGLQKKLKVLLEQYQITNYYVFDMSIPDTIVYLKNGIRSFIRQSEYEKELPFYNESEGVWMDAFESIWYTKKTILDHLKKGKKIVIVSSELHKRDHNQQWRQLKEWGFINNFMGVTLCTDLPVEAEKFFNL